MPDPQPAPRFRQRAAKMSELVARQVVEDIVEQGLPTGAALPTEAQMLQAYGVSRGTLREALRILENNGLVQVRPGRGGGPVVGAAKPHTFGRTLALFLQMDRTPFGELVEARLIMEPMMARLAAERRDPARLRELAESMREHQSLEGRDERDYLPVLQRFHGVLAGVSGNGVLDLFGRALTEIYTERIVAAERRPERWVEVRQEHQAVAEAIVAGDGALAEELMRAHMVALVAHLDRDYAGLRDEIVGW
ncbi:FCD domain-containing protein [Micromonospora sp. NBRC 101691]|uniref:FadR/GntR family transcriptional regulator n=1 Tax=Micromonospora sp. NBRC 101691 TaxID=3032198 RepID=UPI0024A46A5D|nr:FCD domain-containing protein [Micromonospora sp. NBRC 101691]GLY24145.1 GntR family transcriptional regulator [Micromonospora sp. NBRC 101691]